MEINVLTTVQRKMEQEQRHEGLEKKNQPYTVTINFQLFSFYRKLRVFSTNVINFGIFEYFTLIWMQQINSQTRLTENYPTFYSITLSKYFINIIYFVFSSGIIQKKKTNISQNTHSAFFLYNNITKPSVEVHVDMGILK